MTASTPPEPGPREDPAPAAAAPRSSDHPPRPERLPRTYVAIRIGLSIVLVLGLLGASALLLQAGVVDAVRELVTGYLDWLPLVG